MQEVSGPFGTAQEIDLPDIPRAAQTLCLWLITAPRFHPAWSQYLLTCVKLDDDVPGFPAPIRKFVGATHEILLMALSPDKGVRSPESMLNDVLTDQPFGHLTPINIVEQYQATDDEMASLVSACAQGVVHGHLNPETGDAPTRIREEWLVSTVRTLAHIRGEDHAS